MCDSCKKIAKAIRNTQTTRGYVEITFGLAANSKFEPVVTEYVPKKKGRGFKVARNNSRKSDTRPL